MVLSMSQTVPFAGNLPSRKYSRTTLDVHVDVAATEQCYLAKSLASMLIGRKPRENLPLKNSE